jgi:ribonuclease I
MRLCRRAAAVLTASVLAAVSAHRVCEANSTRAEQAGFDLLVLSMMWPFSSCVFLDKLAGDACESPPATFVVRGLRPTSLAGPQPLCCAPSQPSDLRADDALDQVKDIAPQLRRLFPDLSLRGSASDLWAAQWEKYGACTGLSCRAYFRRVLELARRFDFMRALSARGIVASDHRRHKMSAVQRAADAAVGGARVRVRCKQTWRGTVLDALHICLDTSGVRVVDCPASCAEGDVGCCESGSHVTLPFWSRDTGAAGRNASGDGGRGQQHDGAGEHAAEYWAGQATGIIVLVGGVAFWIFKQSTIDRRRTGTGITDYQRIP